MVKTFIVIKHPLAFELHIDGKVEVKPIPNRFFSKKTITLFAEVHQNVIAWHSFKNSSQTIEEIALAYFENRGFEITEKNAEP
jgi:hypothetical protein